MGGCEEIIEQWVGVKRLLNSGCGCEEIIEQWVGVKRLSNSGWV